MKPTFFGRARKKKKDVIYVTLEDVKKARREERRILFCQFRDQASGFAK